ncbi:gamma-interferon-inducible lysosomal thiol reductase [Hydra vulgaris]|uniref:gamma-interferon-inducible lysosomal thiol reductase n=1 Tax=Hydra vulgaris TaxID=6087 RepID=UPI001F5F98EE|nr:gamma-interferon-inducible lysosomal thiol reductase [Hydra vulgaris]
MSVLNLIIGLVILNGCNSLFINKKNDELFYANKTTSLIQDADPVEVTLYFESFCPDCRVTILDQIYPTYQKLASSGILKLNFVPFGNAEEVYSAGKYIFYCQHGQEECTGNLIESCAIHFYPDQAKYVPFIQCLEYYGATDTNAKYCASVSQMDYDTISQCVLSDQGNEIEHEMATKTNALNPPHQYVPWFTMNGQHDDSIQDGLSSNMLAYVCNAYQGTKPEACIQK